MHHIAPWQAALIDSHLDNLNEGKRKLQRATGTDEEPQAKEQLRQVITDVNNAINPLYTED